MRVMKKKTVIIACALSALLFVGCGKSAEVADVSDAAPVESVAEEVKENAEETAEEVEEASEAASSVSEAEVSETEKAGEETTADASKEETTGAATDENNADADKTGEAAQATAQENAQANQDLQMVEGVDYSEWTKRQTWTASNGVTLKIKDDVDLNINFPRVSEFVIIDGDIHPDSSYMVALNEFVDRPELQDVPSDLPIISNSDVKRTSFPNTDPVFLDYQSKVNQVLANQSAFIGVYGLYSDGITTVCGMPGTAWGTVGWDLSYSDSDSYWIVRIFRNMPTVAWNCLRDCLKFVSPDGQLLYDVLYTDFFEGSDYIEDYDMWCPVGSSEIYQIDPSAYKTAIYYFR